MVGLGLVRGKRDIAEDGAEQQPRTEFTADQIGVLALPADPGGGGERLFHHRRGVDEDFNFAAGVRGQPAGQHLQLSLDDVMIVAVSRIDGDRAAVAAPCRRQRILRGPVVDRQHDDASNVGPERFRIGAARERLRHPGHVAVSALSQPLRKVFARSRRQIGRGDPAGVEAERDHLRAPDAAALQAGPALLESLQQQGPC